MVWWDHERASRMQRMQDAGCRSFWVMANWRSQFWEVLVVKKAEDWSQQFTCWSTPTMKLGKFVVDSWIPFEVSLYGNGFVSAELMRHFGARCDATCGWPCGGSGRALGKMVSRTNWNHYGGPLWWWPRQGGTWWFLVSGFAYQQWGVTHWVVQ